jgi:hypothetical protein
VLDAVNRRGRPARVRVTTTRMRGVDEQPVGVIIVMDEQDLTEADGQERVDGAVGLETSSTS